jgi:hypothetical protein
MFLKIVLMLNVSIFVLIKIRSRFMISVSYHINLVLKLDIYIHKIYKYPRGGLINGSKVRIYFKI